MEDKAGRTRFVKHYEEKNRLEEASGKAVLHLGNDDWPFPIPIVKTEKGWKFDTRAGRQEILARRIGRNELDAIQVCLAYVDATEGQAQGRAGRARGFSRMLRNLSVRPANRTAFIGKPKRGQEQSPMVSCYLWPHGKEGMEERHWESRPLIMGTFTGFSRPEGQNAPWWCP